MKLICDLCGNPLTELAENHAVCDHCGMEYGASRLEEMRATENKKNIDSKVEPKTKPQQEKSGCGIWILILVAILDLVVGTHGIVAAFCVIIALIAGAFSNKTKGK